MAAFVSPHTAEDEVIAEVKAFIKCIRSRYFWQVSIA